MRRPILLVLAVLFLPTAARASADLEIFFVRRPQPLLSVGALVSGALAIRNHGPDTAPNVRFALESPLERIYVSVLARSCTNGVCELGTLSSGERIEIEFSGIAPLAGGLLEIAGRASSALDDPAPANNRVSVTIEALTSANLSVSVSLSQPVHPEGKTTLTVYPLNYNSFYRDVVPPATAVEVLVNFPAGSKILGRTGGERFACDLEAVPVRCLAAELPLTKNSSDDALRFRFLAPPLYDGGTIRASASISMADRDPYPEGNFRTETATIRRFFRVTSSADDGPGSLRQTLLEANAAGCSQDCTVGFRITEPLPAEGFFTLRPRSPLPPVTFGGVLRGDTQSDLYADDATKPLVMLDGSQQASGDGLHLSGTNGVAGMAIGNFPRNGIFTDDFAARNRFTGNFVTDVHLGVRPDGETPAPNLRGFVDESTFGATSITRSIIRSNRRSGVVVKYRSASLYDNRIELNGASGVYAAGGGAITARGNVIAHNYELGIALDPLRKEADLRSNSIHSNGAGGIDYGLDGETPNAGDDSHRFPNRPVVLDAHYDAAANETVIRFRVDTRVQPSALPSGYPSHVSSAVATIQLFANRDADADSERLVREVQIDLLKAAPPYEQTVSVAGDLRGQAITAVTYRQRGDCYTDICAYSDRTSEISTPVGVE